MFYFLTHFLMFFYAFNQHQINQIFRPENSIEVIEIDPAWLSDAGPSGVPIKTSTIVAQLPKDLAGAASIIIDNNMLIFGGLSADYVSNPDVITFNIDSNNISILPSVFASMSFGQKTYLLPKGEFLFLVNHLIILK